MKYLGGNDVEGRWTAATQLRLPKLRLRCTGNCSDHDRKTGKPKALETYLGFREALADLGLGKHSCSKILIRDAISRLRRTA
jgi:hypothetical protein